MRLVLFFLYLSSLLFGGEINVSAKASCKEDTIAKTVLVTKLNSADFSAHNQELLFIDDVDFEEEFHPNNSLKKTDRDTTILLSGVYSMCYCGSLFNLYYNNDESINSKAQSTFFGYVSPNYFYNRVLTI